MASVLIGSGDVAADPAVRDAIRANEAEEIFSVTGRGVTIAILDRGIDWTHPDFRHEDGTTRIRWMLDMTGQNLCPGSPAPVEYAEADINAALQGGPAIGMRDAVGHGTATAGLAVGSGRAPSSVEYRGIAPEADLIVIKLVSEGAPAHNGVPAENAFQGCIDDALDWLDAKIDLLNQPCVAIINSGTQWGPIDGTSAVSQKIDEVFGSDRPGRVMIIPSGDEGNLPNHARATFTNRSAGTISFFKSTNATTFGQLWYSGEHPAEITFEFADGTIVGPVGPNQSMNQSGVFIVSYLPGTEFYPWLSISGDRAVWFRITGHVGPGTITVDGLGGPPGAIDAYGDLQSNLHFTDNLTPGRLTDYASTESAIVVGCSVVRTHWTDVNGNNLIADSEGDVDELWGHSSAGPTRDGRIHGVDLVAPGHNSFAALAPDSFYSISTLNQIGDGDGWYVRFQATSASAPIVAGAVGLMLQKNPLLTAEEVRQILRSTAIRDEMTGGEPTAEWGFGRLDVLGAVAAVEPACPGDFNLDRVINGTDLLRLLAGWGPCSGFCAADVDRDGMVNGGDLLLLLANWGACDSA